MSAHVEVLGSPVGAELAQRVIGVTVTVKATTERAAREIATRVLLDEMEGSVCSDPVGGPWRCGSWWA
jgi:hypothetical protein